MGPFDNTALRSALKVPSSTGLTFAGDAVKTLPILLDAPKAIGLNAENSFKAEFARLFPLEEQKEEDGEGGGDGKGGDSNGKWTRRVTQTGQLTTRSANVE
jgi:hypothetical protein